MHHLYDGTAKRIIFFMRMRTFEPGAYAHIPIKCHFKGLLTPWKDCNLINNVKVFSQASQGNTHPTLTRRTRVSVRHPLCGEERCKRRHVALTYPTTARNPHTTETPPPKHVIPLSAFSSL